MRITLYVEFTKKNKLFSRKWVYYFSNYSTMMIDTVLHTLKPIFIALLRFQLRYLQNIAFEGIKHLFSRGKFRWPRSFDENTKKSSGAKPRLYEGWVIKLYIEMGPLIACWFYLLPWILSYGPFRIAELVYA